MINTSSHQPSVNQNPLYSLRWLLLKKNQKITSTGKDVEKLGTPVHHYVNAECAAAMKNSTAALKKVRSELP